MSQGFVPNFVFTPPIQTTEDYELKTGKSSKPLQLTSACKAWNASGENFRPLNEQAPGFDQTSYKKANALLIDGFVGATGINNTLWNGKLGYSAADWSIKNELEGIGATDLDKSNKYGSRYPYEYIGSTYKRMYDAINDAVFGGTFKKGTNTPYSNEEIRDLVVNSGAPIIDEKGHSMIVQEIYHSQECLLQ